MFWNIWITQNVVTLVAFTEVHAHFGKVFFDSTGNHGQITHTTVRAQEPSMIGNSRGRSTKTARSSSSLPTWLPLPTITTVPLEPMVVWITSYSRHWWGRCSHPRVMGTARHTTPDTGQKRLTVVYWSPILTAGRRRTPHTGPRAGCTRGWNEWPWLVWVGQTSL